MSVHAFPLAKPTADIINEALNEDYELVLIVGIKRDGGGWEYTSNMNKETAIYYMEKIKLEALLIDTEEEQP